MDYSSITQEITKALDARHPSWREDIQHFGQEQAVEDRRRGKTWSDEEVLEGLILAILSQQVAWTRIEQARSSLPQVLDGYRIESLAERDADELHDQMRAIRLGSQQLRRICKALPDTAKTLLRIRDRFNGLHDWLRGYETGPVPFISSMAHYASTTKLKMVGVAIACEFLKNVGFPEFKPDVHLCRLFSSARLSLVPAISNPEQPSDSDRLAVRQKGLEWATACEWSPVVLDNALWMFCARGYAAVCGKNPKCAQCPVPTPPCSAPGRS